MTIASEIQRIKDNIANTYTALEEKGATMPEVLNSNNLAGTVATITTGGGGGGGETIDDSSLQMAKSIFNSMKPKNSDSDISDLEKYFTLNSASSSNYTSIANALYVNGSSFLSMLAFDENITEVYLKSDFNCYIVPPTATVTMGDASTPTKIEFNGGDRYVGFLVSYNIFKYSSSTQIGSYINIYPDKFSYTAYRTLISDFITYLGIASLASDKIPYSITPSDQSVVAFGQGFGNLTNLLDYDIKNIQLKTTSAKLKTAYEISTGRPMVMSTCKKFKPSDFFKKLNLTIDNIEYSPSETALDLGPEFGSNIDSFLTYTFPIIHSIGMCNEYPFVLDFSQLPAYTPKLYLHSSNIKSNSYSIGGPNIKIKPGNHNYVIASSDNGGSRTLAMSVDNFKFFANNSPVVSGKTIDLGSCESYTYQKVASEAIETLRSRGWTVNVSS